MDEIEAYLVRLMGRYLTIQFINRTMMEHVAGLDLEKWKERTG